VPLQLVPVHVWPPLGMVVGQLPPPSIAMAPPVPGAASLPGPPSLPRLPPEPGTPPVPVVPPFPAPPLPGTPPLPGVPPLPDVPPVPGVPPLPGAPPEPVTPPEDVTPPLPVVPPFPVVPPVAAVPPEGAPPPVPLVPPFAEEPPPPVVPPAAVPPAPLVTPPPPEQPAASRSARAGPRMEVDDDTLRSTDEDVMSAPLNEQQVNLLTWPILGRPGGTSNTILHMRDPDNAKLGTEIMSVFPSIGSHRSGRARFGHPARRDAGSLCAISVHDARPRQRKPLQQVEQLLPIDLSGTGATRGPLSPDMLRLTEEAIEGVVVRRDAEIAVAPAKLMREGFLLHAYASQPSSRTDHAARETGFPLRKLHSGGFSGIPAARQTEAPASAG